MVLSLAACGGKDNKKDDLGVEKLVADYGFQWKDPNAPILNEKGAEDITFTIYSSKNASALDYNDMKIMQDLFESTNINVFWENVSESVYTQQQNLIFSNMKDRPDAIYHAGMSAGEIIKYAKRGVLVAISDYLEYMPNFAKLLQERPDIYAQLINVEDGENSYMVGWARRSESPSSTQDVAAWGGNLVIQKLAQKENGELVLVPVDSLAEQFDQRRQLLIEGSHIFLQAGSVGVFYIDGIAALTVRIYGASGKPVMLFAENNGVLFTSLRQYTR